MALQSHSRGTKNAIAKGGLQNYEERIRKESNFPVRLKKLQEFLYS